MKNLDSLLQEVSDKMPVDYTNTFFDFVEDDNFGCLRFNYNDIALQDNKIEVKNAGFFIPKSILENDLAIKGFMAHETAHIILAEESILHRAYLWMRKRSSGFYFPFVDSLLFILPALAFHPIEERKVDDLVRKYGLDKELNEVARITGSRGIS